MKHNPTHADIVARMGEVRTELERFGQGEGNLTRSEAYRFDSLREEFHELDEARKQAERELDRAKIRRFAAGERSGIRTVPAVPGDQGDPFETPDRDAFNPLANLRDAAYRILDAGTRDGSLPDYAAERVEKLMTTGARQATTYATRWAALTGSEAYRSAFAKLVTDPERGHLLWTAQEADAFREARTFQMEERAMSLTDNAGGYLVPMHLDPAILLTSNGSSDPLRQIARVEQISGDTWNGVSSQGATAEWKAEAAQAADGSPTLAQPSIPVHFGDVFVPFSYEVGMDAPNLLEQLAVVLNDAADQLMSTAYWRGSGTGQPTGLITALLAASPSVSVATGTADTLVANDMTKLQEALPARFQANATFAASLGTINALGSLETTNGALRFPEVKDGRLLNRALVEASSLDKAGAAATAGNDEVAVYGDFKQFVIVDRLGTQLDLISNLFGANGRPTGQRGAFLYFRTGSDSVVDNAFRVLTA